MRQDSGHHRARGRDREQVLLPGCWVGLLGRPGDARWHRQARRSLRAHRARSAMTSRRHVGPCSGLAIVMFVVGCSNAPAVAVTGSVQGNSFSDVAAAYWIGAPGAGSPPVIIFILE